ncbi:hypothetical protein [Pseudoroseomonas ludipueritiae]|uniref:Uncharacterized protein n=1 Tax=Pseudoroseomonas ludipueritiae TaxID=198093 RepID=A0ABR7R8E1_9PROT|nr:hypothetical protein [Pseudoroseomonas ludipueritiae]MBC9177942.1 hypothetical protein [Pseudoroseomonas ludipueritiae]
MKMNHALRVAASQAAQPDDILSVAGRLAGRGPLTALCAAPASLPMPRPAPPAGPDNLGTLHACQGLLARTIALLE